MQNITPRSLEILSITLIFSLLSLATLHAPTHTKYPSCYFFPNWITHFAPKKYSSVSYFSKQTNKKDIAYGRRKLFDVDFKCVRAYAATPDMQIQNNQIRPNNLNNISFERTSNLQHLHNPQTALDIHFVHENK